MKRFVIVIVVFPSTLWASAIINPGTGGGGGSSSLAVTTGNPSGFTSIISSPTAVINFSSNTFTASLERSATAYIDLNVNSCNGANQALTWDPAKKAFGCATLSGTFQTCGSNPVGILLMDPANCSWCGQLNTSGALVTTLISCSGAPLSPSTQCPSGRSIGLLLSLTCT